MHLRSPSRTSFSLLCSAVLVAFVFVQASLLSAEWPQWRGPNRDGVWRETGMIEAIPPNGLKVRWRVRIGRGYSGPVVA